MIHPDTELRFINKDIGYGVFATKLIPKGTITWAYDILDRTFLKSQIDSMDKRFREVMDKYSYRDSNGNFVLCWDNARFVNHSFNSSCITTAYNFELAVRDIYPGEELTDDYGYLNCIEQFDCIPEDGTLRACVMPDDLLHFYKIWDNKLLSSFEHLLMAEQPLWSLIDPQYIKKVEGIANNTDQMDSILNTFYNEDEALMVKKETLLRSYHPRKSPREIILA